MKRSRESGTLNSPWIKQGYQKKGPLAQSRPRQWVSAAPYCPGFASCSSGGLVCSLAFSGQSRRRVTLDCLNIFFQTSCSHSFVECTWTEENPHGGRDQVHVVRGESFLSRGRNWKQSSAEVGLHKDVRTLPSTGQHLVDSRIRIRPKDKALCRYLLLYAARKVTLDLTPVLRGKEFQPDCRVWSNSLPRLIWLHVCVLETLPSIQYLLRCLLCLGHHTSNKIWKWKKADNDACPHGTDMLVEETAVTHSTGDLITPFDTGSWEEEKSYEEECRKNKPKSLD